MKCSGETAECSRCLRDGIACHYSWQKPMGRPRKRRRTEPQADLTVPAPGDGLTQPLDAEMMATPEQSTRIHDTSTSLVVGLKSPGFGDFNTLPPIAYDTPQIDHFSLEHVALSPPTAPPSSALTSDSPSTHEPHDCACIASLFLALTNLQSLTVHFPLALPQLRVALSTARTAFSCKRCATTTSFVPPFQSMMFIGTLLPLIAEGYSRVLRWIDDEADAVAAAQGKKTLKMADFSLETAGLHTGMPDCPMSFEVELEPAEWRRLARQVVQRDVSGGDDGASASRLGLLGLLEQMRKRQQTRHSQPPEQPPCGKNMPGARAGETPLCLRIIQNISDVIRCLEIQD